MNIFLKDEKWESFKTIFFMFVKKIIHFCTTNISTKFFINILKKKFLFTSFWAFCALKRKDDKSVFRNFCECMMNTHTYTHGHTHTHIFCLWILSLMPKHRANAKYILHKNHPRDAQANRSSGTAGKVRIGRGGRIRWGWRVEAWNGRGNKRCSTMKKALVPNWQYLRQVEATTQKLSRKSVQNEPNKTNSGFII